MVAEVTPTGPRRCQAWCAICTDGVNGSRAYCDVWTVDHNNTKHPTEPKDTK